jgi:hypothetical protein
MREAGALVARRFGEIAPLVKGALERTGER